MKSKYTNPCSRCGKERILKKKWKEQVPTFSGTYIEITRTENICPDPDCQIKLDEELEGLRKKREERMNKSLARKVKQD